MTATALYPRSLPVRIARWVAVLPIKALCAVLALLLGVMSLLMLPILHLVVWLAEFAYKGTTNPYEQRQAN